jgi:hypothetical protein
MSVSRLLLPWVLLTAALAAAAADPKGPPPPRAADDVVHDAMEGLKKQLKLLATATPDPARRAEALGALSEMQRFVLVAKAEKPSNLGERPEAERPAHALAFRRDLAQLLAELARIEIALCEDRPDDALLSVKGVLPELREAGHDKYQESGEHAEHEEAGGDGAR